MRILITGLSGSGKSSVIRALTTRGFRAYDLDDPEWSEWVDSDVGDSLTPRAGQDWRWREDRVRALLSAAGEERLFIAGCAENMGQLKPLIDRSFYLSAPAPLLIERLAKRPAGEYGHSAEDHRKVEALSSSVGPLLRAFADHEIDASLPLAQVVETILRHAALA